MERARLDPATVEKRKQLLESAVSSKGSGLRATMARRLKMKQQVMTSPVPSHSLAALCPEFE